MKRFWVFGGSVFYPCGGIEDLLLQSDSFEDAKAALSDYLKDSKWGQVYDTHKDTLIVHYYDGDNVITE